MATFTFHPAVLAAALHAGSAAARLTATETDPDGGGWPSPPSPTAP